MVRPTANTVSIDDLDVTRFHGERLTIESVRLMRAEPEVDCSKARRERAWQPRPVEQSVRAAR